MDLKKYRNKAEMKECKTTLLRNDGGKEQEDYPTTDVG